MDILANLLSTSQGGSTDASGVYHADPHYRRYSPQAPPKAPYKFEGVGAKPSTPPMSGEEYPSALLPVLPQMAPEGAKPIPAAGSNANSMVYGGEQPQIHTSPTKRSPSAPKIPMGDASVGYNPTGSIVGDDGGPLVGHNPQTSLVPPEVPPELLASSPIMQMMGGMPMSQGQPVSQMAPQGGHHNLFKTLMSRAAHGAGHIF